MRQYSSQQGGEKTTGMLLHHLKSLQTAFSLHTIQHIATRIYFSHTKIKRCEVRIDTDIQIKNKTLTEYKGAWWISGSCLVNAVIKLHIIRLFNKEVSLPKISLASQYGHSMMD